MGCSGRYSLRHPGATQMTKLQRVRDIYGPGNPIPVGKTNFFENYIHDDKG